MFNNSREARAMFGQRNRMKGDRKLGRKLRESLNKTRITGDFDRGRQLCYKGKKVVIFQDDINKHPNMELRFKVFTYIWSGDKSHWDLKWQRVNDLKAFGEWILQRDPTRLTN